MRETLADRWRHQDAEILRLHEQHVTMPVIADTVGCPYTTVRQVVRASRAAGAQPDRRPDLRASRSAAGISALLALPVSQLARDMLADTAPGLTSSQMDVLTTLEAHPRITAGQLAGHIGIAPPSLTRKLTALQAKGLIVARPHPDDKRCLTYTVTGQGHKALSYARQHTQLALRVGQLTEDERSALRAAIPVLAKLGAMTWLTEAADTAHAADESTDTADAEAVAS